MALLYLLDDVHAHCQLLINHGAHFHHTSIKRAQPFHCHIISDYCGNSLIVLFHLQFSIKCHAHFQASSLAQIAIQIPLPSFDHKCHSNPRPSLPVQWHFHVNPILSFPPQSPFQCYHYQFLRSPFQCHLIVRFY